MSDRSSARSGGRNGPGQVKQHSPDGRTRVPCVGRRVARAQSMTELHELVPLRAVSYRGASPAGPGRAPASAHLRAWEPRPALPPAPVAARRRTPAAAVPDSDVGPANHRRAPHQHAPCLQSRAQFIRRGGMAEEMCEWLDRRRAVEGDRALAGLVGPAGVGRVGEGPEEGEAARQLPEPLPRAAIVVGQNGSWPTTMARAGPW